MNAHSAASKAYTFFLDFELHSGFCLNQKEIEDSDIFYEFLGPLPKPTDHKHLTWKFRPPSKQKYQKAFELVQHHLNRGDSYLLNLCFPSRLDCNWSLAEIYQHSKAPYKVYVPGEFVCFSPESFVKINKHQISTFPMKGTINATLPNAEKTILDDLKESSEHATIVDLLRNDLSRVATDIEVSRYRYIDRIKSHRGELLQVSSEINGTILEEYRQRHGDLFRRLLPAGSISGAPKKKTLEIIRDAENHSRGPYTGVMGHFDGKNLDSCVLIRMIRMINGAYYFYSGGGITALSKMEDEYRELQDKIYLPLL